MEVWLALLCVAVQLTGMCIWKIGRNSRSSCGAFEVLTTEVEDTSIA